MNIFISTIKIIAIYILSCGVAFFILFLAGTALDIENIAWIVYEYLHSHYGLYEDIYKYDFNPALGDFIIIWMLLLPAFMTFIVLIVKKRLTKRHYR